MNEKKRRPRSDVKQDGILHIRMNKDFIKALDMESYESDTPKSEVVRKALAMYLSGKKGLY